MTNGDLLIALRDDGALGALQITLMVVGALTIAGFAGCWVWFFIHRTVVRRAHKDRQTKAVLNGMNAAEALSALAPVAHSRNCPFCLDGQEHGSEEW